MIARNRIFGAALAVALVRLSFGQPDIVSYEYFFDTDPGQGNGTLVDLPVEERGPQGNLSITIPQATLEGLSDGLHRVGFRTKDADGDWSVAFVRSLIVGEDTGQQPVPDIAAAEYFFDTDPGQGNGTAIDLAGATGTSINIAVAIPKEAIEALPLGFHKLVVRTQDADGDWSVAFSRQFNRVEAPSLEQSEPKVARIEYQWLIEGEPVGDLVTLTPDEPAQTIDFTEIADLSDLPGGGVEAVLRVTTFDTAGN